MRLTSIIKKVLRHVGVEARRYGVQTSPDAQLGRILNHFGVDLIFDVGAHEGQYAKALRMLGYCGRIVSFEPQAVVYARLLEASRNDPMWEVAPRGAVGDQDQDLVLHISAHSLSSSILEMLPLHEQAAPGSEIIATERVQVRTLDQLAPLYIRDAQNIFLKIDTQGYEHHVLNGANRILNKIKLIQAELSLVPLYADQLLFDEMRESLLSLGFRLYALFPGYVHEKTGETLQVDGLFVRHG